MMAGMMGAGSMFAAGRMAPEDTKNQLKTLTRTDFLLQFVWKPLTPEEQPKTVEERDAKYKDIKSKMEAEEKNHPAVVMPKSEEIESASLKQSEAVNSALNKALNAPAGAGASGPGGGGPPGMGSPTNPTPGFGPGRGGANAPPSSKGATAPRRNDRIRQRWRATAGAAAPSARAPAAASGALYPVARCSKGTTGSARTFPLSKIVTRSLF